MRFTGSMMRWTFIFVAVSLFGLNVFYYMKSKGDIPVHITHDETNIELSNEESSESDEIQTTDETQTTEKSSTTNIIEPPTKQTRNLEEKHHTSGPVNNIGDANGNPLTEIENVSDRLITDIGNTLDMHIINKQTQMPVGDSDDSSIQMPKKTGFCYIGHENNKRACIYVGKRDQCMSGDIFPSMDICINPNLRA